MKTIALTAFAAVSLAIAAPAIAQDVSKMTFFVTSVGSGDGANLGGIATQVTFAEIDPALKGCISAHLESLTSLEVGDGVLAAASCTVRAMP